MTIEEVAAGGQASGQAPGQAWAPDEEEQRGARAWVCAATAERLRTLHPRDDVEWERLCWEGYEGLPGSVVAALYPLLKQYPEKSDEALAHLALADPERMALLEKNLRWEAEVLGRDKRAEA